MTRRFRLSLLLYALCTISTWLQLHAAQAAPSLDVLATLEEIDAIESSPKLYALLVVSSEEAKDGIDALVEMATKAYPSLPKLGKDLDGIAKFAVVDIAAQKKALVSKWNLQGLPALLVYKDEPKENPYTGKVYRNPLLGSVELLNQPAKLKKMLRDSVPSTFVTEIKKEQVASKEALEKMIQEHTQDGEKLVLLVSKQKKPSHLYRALSTELHDQGLRFAYLKYDEKETEDASNNAILRFFDLKKVPALLVIQSASEFQGLEEDKMKTFKDLKAFTEQYANKDATSKKKSKKNQSEKKGLKLDFLTENTFDQEILKSKVIWIIAFTDSDQVAASIEATWKKTFDELQKKAGMVAIAAVKCDKEPALCKKYGGAGIRIFPIKLSQRGLIERGEVLPETFTELEVAKEAALASIPDQSQVILSSADLNGFVSRAALSKSMPVLLFTSKTETPAVLKSIALSLPSHNVVFGIVPDADPQVKAQFTIPATTSTALACLVPSQKEDPDQPEGASPFGIIVYSKKALGPYTYENMMHFMLSVLSQYPHSKEIVASDEALNEELVSTGSVASSTAAVPYLKKDNFAELCGGNKICAIGFFDGHITTLSDTESSLSKSMGVFSKVATLSKKSKEPFQFMWTNGKCQRAFAEAFGVGEFQMPTVVVYSPSKSRYATNVGTFTEENTHGFLKSVLSGKIGTTPVAEVADLRDECTFEEMHDDAAAAIDDGEDDEDLLSEILNDEQKQRELLEEQLKAEEKESGKGKKSKKSKKSKKKKGKKNKRDELTYSQITRSRVCDELDAAGARSTVVPNLGHWSSLTGGLAVRTSILERPARPVVFDFDQDRQSRGDRDEDAQCLERVGVASNLLEEEGPAHGAKVATRADHPRGRASVARKNVRHDCVRCARTRLHKESKRDEVADAPGQVRRLAVQVQERRLVCEYCKVDSRPSLHAVFEVDNVRRVPTSSPCKDAHEPKKRRDQSRSGLRQDSAFLWVFGQVAVGLLEILKIVQTEHVVNNELDAKAACVLVREDPGRGPAQGHPDRRRHLSHRWSQFRLTRGLEVAGKADRDHENSRQNQRESPTSVVRDIHVDREQIEDKWRDHVRDARTQVAPTCSKRVGASDDLGAEHDGRPVGRHNERAAHESDEEAHDYKPVVVCHQRRRRDGDRAQNEEHRLHGSRTVAISQRTRDHAADDRARHGRDVGVGHLVARELQLSLDRRHEWRDGEPAEERDKEREPREVERAHVRPHVAEEADFARLVILVRVGGDREDATSEARYRDASLVSSALRLIIGQPELRHIRA